MRTVQSIIEDLRKSRIQLFLKEENIEIISNLKEIDKSILNELQSRKKEIVEYLKRNTKNDVSANVIKPVPLAAKYQLSSSQKRLWLVCQFKEMNKAYNIPKVHIFNGILELNAFEKAVKKLMIRHESLRTVFLNEDGDVFQSIQEIDELDFKLKVCDLRSKENLDEVIRTNTEKDIIEAFDLSSGPLFRVSAYQIANDKWVLVYVIHHLVSDGWSMEILKRELFYYYEAILNGDTEETLRPLKFQYKDYSVWQQDQLQTEEINISENYWLNQFQGEIPILDVPSDFTRPVMKTYNGGAVTQLLSLELCERLKKINQQMETTMYMTLFAGVNALMYRYTGQEDIVLGSPIAGREHAGLEGIIGFFVNTLALRSRFKGSDNFLDLLTEVKKITKDAYKHQSYPFDELVTNLKLHRDRSRNPLFDVMVTLKNSKEYHNGDNSKLEEISLSDESQICIFDLTFTFIESSKGIELNLGFNKDIYSKETIERMCKHYCQIMESIVQNPTISLKDLDYLSEMEKKKLTLEFNSSLPETNLLDKTVMECFKEQVERTPDQIALVFEDITLSYKVLDTVSDQLANYLKTKYQILPNDLIGIKLERTEWMIISIMAVLKTGGAYAPIDPEYPQDRIDYMVEDSKCKVLIDNDQLELFKNRVQHNTSNDLSAPRVDSLAYVIYTSGTTGNPKGVMIEHRSLSSYMNSCKEKYKFKDQPVVPFLASHSFDISLFHFLFPLLIGGKVLIFSKNVINNIQILTDKLKEATILDTVPALMSQILSEIEHRNTFSDYEGITDLFIGGDLIPDELLGKMKKVFPKAHINVTYGPTESTVFVTGKEYREDGINSWDGTLIGTPNNNANIYILDANSQLVPIGIDGEIHISGPAVARGYLHQEKLTQEKFIINKSLANLRLYKTGDVAKWLPDGNIKYVGRTDRQIKLRGFRIELGEIEKAALNYPDIETVVAQVVKMKDQQKELVIYIVSAQVLNISNFRTHLSKILPGYMIPGKIIQLEKIPLTSNGKLDRKILDQIDELEMDSNIKYLAPRNELEEKIVKIWQTLLEREKIGVDDNFFEAGGNSIKIIRLSREMSDVFNKEVTIAELFEFPTISEIVSYMKGDVSIENEEEVLDRDELINVFSKFN